MAWTARLSLDYCVEAGRTVARHTHSGPLRILQSLYPEGDGVCHNVLVHPPGGLVGGDTLEIAVHAHEGAHGLITTPGATRFYRSEGSPARQITRLTLANDARLEWLPLETLCYSGCLAENDLTMELAPGAELMGWDVTALGLPHAGQPFVAGSLSTRIAVPGVWLEQGSMAAHDTRLLDGPAGLGGHRCIASLFLVSGSALSRERRQLALDGARSALAQQPEATHCGVTSPNARVVVVRLLSAQVEPAMAALRRVRDDWRQRLWAKSASNPRIWSM